MLVAFASPSNGQRIATRVDGSLYYVHSDLLGSTVALSDAAGQAVGRVQYDPYGEVLTSTLPADLTDRLFTGQRFDSRSGLYYYNARYYDPYLGRFIQPDTLVPDPLSPQAWNRFSYVYNNPATFNDPSGHLIPAAVALPLLFIAGGALVGELAYAGHLHYTGEQANAGELLNWMAWGAFAGATVYMAPYMAGYGLSLAGMDAIGASIWLSRMGVSAYWLMYAGLWANNTWYFLQCNGWAGALPEGDVVIRFAKEAHYRRIARFGMMKIKDFQTFATTPEHLLSLGTNDPAVIAKDLGIPLDRAQYFVAIRREVLDRAGVVWSEQEWEIVWRFLESELETINLSGYIVDMGKTEKLSEEFLRGLLGQ